MSVLCMRISHRLWWRYHMPIISTLCAKSVYFVYLSHHIPSLTLFPPTLLCLRSLFFCTFFYKIRIQSRYLLPFFCVVCDFGWSIECRSPSGAIFFICVMEMLKYSCSIYSNTFDEYSLFDPPLVPSPFDPVQPSWNYMLWIFNTSKRFRMRNAFFFLYHFC